MACCSYRRRRLVNQASIDVDEVEKEGDEMEMDTLEMEQVSRVSTIESEKSEKYGDEVDPDSLSSCQVIISVILLCAFAFSFATSFILLKTAVHSLEANFTGENYTCEIAKLTDYDIECLGTNERAQCVNIHLRCLEFGNDTKIMYEFYQDYYNPQKGAKRWCCNESDDEVCSTPRCIDPDRYYFNKETNERYKYPLALVKRCCAEKISENLSDWKEYPADLDENDLYKEDYLFVSRDTFQFDQNKPEAIFYKQNNDGTNSMVLSRTISYVIIIVPQAVMALIAVIAMFLFMANKLTAKELYRPVTPITPLHLQVNGKWYLKEIKPENIQMNAFEKLRAAQNS